MTFVEANLSDQSVPLASEVPHAAGQVFTKGALGVLVAGEFTEAASPAATPANVTHVAQGYAGPGLTTGPFAGFGDIAGVRSFPPGRVVVTEKFSTKWRARTNSTPAALDALAIGTLLDAVINASDEWVLDVAGTPGTLVRLIGKLPGIPGVPNTEGLVEFLP